MRCNLTTTRSRALRGALEIPWREVFLGAPFATVRLTVPASGTAVWATHCDASSFIRAVLAISETNRSNVGSGIVGVTEVENGSSVSVLVVDDFEQWRKAVCAALRTNLGLHIFEEAADGLEAVQKAQAMQPDLVVLDIGLPTLNGIEVAQHIKRISAKSKVVFLTENRFLDITEAALQDGASGYVMKSAFASEMIPAIKAVLEGKQFLSARLTALAMEARKAA